RRPRSPTRWRASAPAASARPAGGGIMAQGEVGASPRVVHAGPVTALLDGGFLRRIRVGPHELVRGVYAAVRDQNWGTIEERFPELISPSRDVTDMEAIRYAVGPVGVELRFEGDRFDMEDQRNWTDASYKTFCTPLRQPYPVQLEAGHRVRQRVVVELDI